MVSEGPHAISQGPSAPAKKSARWLINTRHVLVNADCRLKGVYKGPVWQVTTILSVGRRSGARPTRLQARLSF